MNVRNSIGGQGWKLVVREAQISMIDDDSLCIGRWFNREVKDQLCLSVTEIAKVGRCGCLYISSMMVHIGVKGSTLSVRPWLVVSTEDSR